MMKAYLELVDVETGKQVSLFSPDPIDVVVMTHRHSNTTEFMPPPGVYDIEKLTSGVEVVQPGLFSLGGELVGWLGSSSSMAQGDIYSLTVENELTLNGKSVSPDEFRQYLDQIMG